MSSRRSVKRSLVLDDDDDEDIFYNFKVLLPNGTSVKLTLKNPEPEISMQSFVNLVKKEYDNARKDCLLMSKRMKVDWNSGGKFHLESNGGKMKGIVRFAAFKPDLCHIIRLDDGSGIASTMYENLWDLTPDTDLLKELPENYSFETALADLIDNSLQAVWPYREGARKLISVDISGDHITVFDTGRGMDSSEGNSIDKWGKIGASLHRSQKTGAIGGNPPYLKPYFGMFGYGGPYASMFLGRRTLVSSKTKESKKVFTLQFKKEALIDNRSIVGKNWKTDGGMRDPSEEEMKLSPHGSFTKVEIFESEFDISKIYQLQCRLKDIYFPYIQCDELSKTGRTERPVAFQVNGEDLAEIAGGEVAITNLHSKGQFFSFQIRFTLFGGKRKGTAQEANARLKFVYFPIVQGKESIEKILQSLEEEGCKVSESFQTFGRVSLRRLGRLLPEVRWDSIPFMQRGNRASTLQKSCRRVKCFVDLDAGFSPTPSKTDLASQNPFSVALRNFGSKSTEKEKDDDVNIVIHREGKSVSYAHLEEKYQEWVLEMHNTHDEEAASGLDEAVLIVGSLDKKALGILRDAVRVHKEVRRKEKTWKRGQNIKILRGAYAGIHNNNVYATIDYFLIEGFEDEAGGDTRILCRPIDRPENEGCKLSIIDGISKLEVQSSLSLPITIIDSGKCLPVDANEWNRKLDKQQEKAPSKIDLLDERDCRELKIDGELPIGNSVRAGKAPPKQIVAVVRPACFTSLTPSKKLDQKNIVKMDGEEMVMVVKLKSSDKNISSQRLFPTSRKGISGLYIFSLGSKFPNLFKKAGTYNFSFSIGNSIKCNKTVVVRPSSKAARWELDDNLESLPCNVRVGSSLPPFRIACFDKYKNKIPFTSVPSLEVELEASPGFLIKIDKLETNLINDGLILKIENMLVETDELDQIRPNYEATLEIRAMDNPFSVSVPCKVNPGPLKRVAVNNPKALENLLPDSTVEDFILELFDGYNNHVAEGTDVLIHIDGYRIEDWMGINRKVDSRGCINLSGILKVTEGYGKSVSLSVMSGNEVIFCKESQIDERQLRLVTELPDCCTAGTNLMNLIFQVTELDGSLDTSIHHDEKSGCFHTMSIESDSSSVESAIRYAFVHGSCKVSSLSLPENEGVFSCRVFHSRYPELQMSIKIQVTSAPTSEREESGYSTPHSKTTPPPESGIPSITNPWPTPCSQFGVLAIRSSSLALSSETSLMDMAQYTEDLKEKINIDEERRVELEERLKCLQAQREHAEQECSRLQASLEPLGAPFPECLSTKESMMKQIEEKHHDTAASVFCCLYRKAPPPRSLFLSQKGMFGVVALLGSVASTSLSRVLSEYLGKDTMLSLVCKSSQFGPKSDEYRKFQSEAASLGRSITNRFLVICLDATRPWRNGLVRNDPQKRLAMDNPYLPNGDPIPGFKGYAVNMIDLASEELDIQSSSGYGLRETLFYGVFRELQVYETAEHLEAALPHINGGDAVSLDGVIARENGFIYSGCCTPEVHFPITVTERQEKALVQLEITRDKKRKTEEMMTEENRSLRSRGLVDYSNRNQSSNSKMSNKRSVGRVLSLDDDEAEDKFYRLKVLLPNSTSVTLALTNPEPRMSMNNFVNLVKEEYEKSLNKCVLSGKKRKRVDWNLAVKYYLEFNGEKIKEIVRFDKFKPDLCNVLRLDICKTARTENPSQSEEYNPSEEQVLLGDDNEETKQISMDSEEETEPLRPLKMYFSPSDYLKPFKIGTKCYIHQVVNILESHLSSEEKKWFWEHPQFKHFFHMHTDSNHKVMAMWMLLLRTACVDKKKECWFVVNGVPIRYSLQELALISGLYCHSYPKNYKAFGSLGFSGKHFGVGATVTYAKVKTKLLSMKKSSRERLKMAVLFFLCSVIIGKRKTGEKAEAVEDFFLKSVEDLEWCKTFPWGRLAFDKNMKDIFHLMDHFDEELGAAWVFPSFVMQLLAFETIPNLMNNFRKHVREADPECPRMCKMKFKPSSMKGFPISELYDTLGTTKEIKSIMLPSPSEKELLKQIMDDEVGHDDVDDMIVDGWTKRIIKENKPICFEELHIQDVSSREIEANPKNANVVGVRVGRKKVALKKVSEKGIVEQLQKQLEDGLNRIYMKIDDMDTRLTYVESCVKNLKEAKDTKGEKEDGEKEKELEENDLEEDETETDKEKEKEDESSEKRSKVERMYGRKRTRTTTAKEQEEKGEEIQVGFQETSERGRKKAKLTWKKVDIKGVTADQGNSITTNERVVVEPSSKVGSWKLASNLKSTRQYNVQVGSSLPPCSISCVDEPFSVSVSCKVNPGPLKHVVEKYPEALENLLPGSTVQNYILEVFDGYNNHVAEGTNVLICIEGYCINDSMGLNQKVNSCGCIDLSGILQVTAGYGKTISLSVMSGIDEIFKKESQTERRELMLLTKLPECCVAGSNLTNLIFKVTDSDGVMDTSIHHDEKSGCFHTMSIETDSSSDESEIRYAFVHGSCKVPTLSLPEREGVFSFKVFHSRFPELHLSLKIQLTPAQILQRDETSYSRMGLTPKSKMASTTYSPALSSQTGPSLRDVAQFTESFKENLIGYSEHRVEIDERLHCLEAEQNQAKEELRTLQASLEPLGAMFPECLSTKESMMKQIEEKHHDTAASVFCCLYRKSPPPQSLFLSKKGVFGLVALLGSVASTSLSRVLSEYLGEDMLLALVCKSAQIGPNNAEFLRLQSNHRFHVLCLDAIRPWKDGLLENDPQKKLAMDDPKLPDGDPIPGFKGYAVNMIDLAPEELTVQTYSGYGLRETLFYNLFGNLQV